MNCLSLKNIIIQGSVTKIELATFKNRPSLTTVKIPKNTRAERGPLLK